MTDVLDATSHLTLPELVEKRCRTTPERVSYVFLADDSDASESVTYADLLRMIATIGARLKATTRRGDRVLLLHPTGREFIGSFLACLWTGRIAVPVHLPSARRLEPTARIAGDCGASAVLTTQRVRARLFEHLPAHPDLARATWLDSEVDTGAGSPPPLPAGTPVDTAFLQYTSGSTGTPRGVRVQHDNLAENLATIAEAFGHTRDSCAVIWLPHFHDMGLIGGMLQPLFADFTAVMLSPTTFVRDPFTWLRTISEYRASTSGGPNFAFEMVLRSVTPEQAATLDLSCWKVAFVGAEPVSPSMLDRFAEHFAASGFEPGALFPCYGLAEATLYVSGGPLGVVPCTRTVPDDAVPGAADNSTDGTDGGGAAPVGRTVVSCGPWSKGDEVRIVDPDTALPVPEGRLGEIWLAGPSITRGYWGHPEGEGAGPESDFRGRLAGPGAPATSYLRTGDVGFVDDSELYVTGRIKDMLIVRGRNLYPQDVERTVEERIAAVRVNGSIAFSVPVDGEERLVVIVEVDARSGVPVDSPEVGAAVRDVVSAEYLVAVHCVEQVRPGRIPRTTSGKLRRREVRRTFLDRTNGHGTA